MSSASSTSRANSMRRKRSYCKAGLYMASAVAISLSGISKAFQSTAVLISRSCQKESSSSSSLTKLGVVTDPKELIRMELQNRDSLSRQALEEIYLISTTEQDDFASGLVEVPRKKSKVKTKANIKQMTALAENTESWGDQKAGGKKRGERVFFRGLSTGPDKRFRNNFESRLGRMLPSSKSNFEESQSNRISSKSSTMPGFSDGSMTARQRAYHDGIKIAEERSGKKFVETAVQKERRRAVNGSAMYRSSASVPDSLVQFANEIHEVERITPKEEIVLGEKTQEAIRLQKIYDGLEAKLAREPTDEEWCAASGKINMEAISQAIEEGLEAKNKLVTANIRMVQGVVNVYIRNGLQGQYNAGDLMQEGIMALIRAAEKFDPGRGFRFSTYAMYWIRSSIKRDQVVQSRIVTVPQRLYENHKRIQKTRFQLAVDLGRPPSRAELGEAVGMSSEQLDRCLSAMAQQFYSLDQTFANPLKPISVDNREDTMYEFVESKTDEDDYSKQTHSFLREDLITLLTQHLTEEEVKLLLLRYGMVHSLPPNLKRGSLTIAEVSRIVGYKPDKVRRIINRSLRHMKAVIGDEWIEYERELQ